MNIVISTKDSVIYIVDNFTGDIKEKFYLSSPAIDFNIVHDVAYCANGTTNIEEIKLVQV